MAAPADDTRAGLTPPADLTTPRPEAPARRELTPHEVLVRHALEVSRVTVTRMAEELGIPRATLEAYRLGTRRMPPAARQRLAAYLGQHAELLRLLSQALNTND
jgi:plasmid maintenance system antidote protein VapI